MDLTLIVVLVLLCFSSCTITLLARPLKHSTHITVAGVVYCDICSNNGFSRHSYFLPGVDVNIRCRFKAISPRTAEKVTFSVNRTTDKYGVYNLEIPSVDGVNCVDGLSIESTCQASLLGGSPESSCNVPVLKTTTNEVSAKSKQDNVCLYSLSAMSYKPLETNATLCASDNEEVKIMGSSLNSSKFFIPYLPPYFWPPLPEFPFPNLPPFPFPNLPPLPSLPFPPLPHFPYFPFPFAPPPPPAFDLGDPRTWIPGLPPPAFDLGDPRTWIPGLPPLSFPPPPPPPPPAFSLTDPTTWAPYLPPSPPATPQNQKP